MSVITTKKKERLRLTDEDGRFYFGWKIVIFLFVLNFFAYSCAISTSGLFQVAILEDMKFTVGEWTQTSALGGPIGGILLSLGAKLMTEKYLKKTMIACGIICVIAFFLQSIATEYWQFFVTMTVFGITSTFITITPAQIIVSNWFGSRARGFAISLILGGLAAVIASPIIGYIIETFSWRSGYRFIAMGILICVFGMFMFIIYSPAQKGVTRMGEDEIEQSARGTEKTGYRVKEGHKKPIVWLVYLASIFTYVCSANMLIHTATYLTLNGISPIVITTVMTAMFALLMAGCVGEGICCDRGFLKVVAPVAELFMAAAYVSLLLIPFLGSWMLVVFVICYALGVPSVNVVTPLVVTHVVGEKHTPEFMSYCMALVSIGMPIFIVGIGQMFDLSGSYAVPFFICIALAIVAAIIRGVATTKRHRYIA